MLRKLRLRLIRIFPGIFLIIPGLAANEFTHLGCFTDSVSQRALPEYLGVVNSVQQCSGLAGKKDYVIFGVQIFHECWSGPDGENTYNRHGPSNICEAGKGNKDAFDVYRHKPVNGVWSLWSAWEACSVTCGGGSQSRKRTCTPPRFGGTACAGVNIDTRKCGTKDCPVCRSMNFDPFISPNMALKHHVIQTHVIESEQICRIKCYINYDCVSYNLGPSSTPGMMICQLNDADRYQYPQDYQDTPGHSYRGTENACRSNPCVANTMCQAGFGLENYRCI